MREGDDLFFAPGVRFVDVDLSGPRLADQYRTRVNGFYLQPARLCIDQKFSFAAGLLLVSTIDFMAGFHHSAEELPDRPVGLDFRAFAQRELPSFCAEHLVRRFYDDYRNGLSHEGRIKKGGEFTLDQPQTVLRTGGVLRINPTHLLKEVEDALGRQMNELAMNAGRRIQMANRLRTLFKKEFGIIERARRSA